MQYEGPNSYQSKDRPILKNCFFENMANVIVFLMKMTLKTDLDLAVKLELVTNKNVLS